MNALVGRKIAIVSDKPQTTRRHIRAILNTEEAQVVFTDTPGFHKPSTLLGTRLNNLVRDAVEGVDAVVLVVDVAAGVGRGRRVRVRAAGRGADGDRRSASRTRSTACTTTTSCRSSRPCRSWGSSTRSCRCRRATARASTCCATCCWRACPKGRRCFPSDEDTDEPLEITLAELVREQALRVTREEVPHSIAVVVEEMEREGDLTKIHASLVVERDSQKGIVIGHGGETLKAIGTAARMQMEPLLGTRVFLDLRVKVLKEWQRDPRALDRLGL